MHVFPISWVDSSFVWWFMIIIFGFALSAHYQRWALLMEKLVSTQLLLPAHRFDANVQWRGSHSFVSYRVHSHDWERILWRKNWTRQLVCVFGWQKAAQKREADPRGLMRLQEAKKRESSVNSLSDLLRIMLRTIKPPIVLLLPRFVFVVSSEQFTSWRYPRTLLLFSSWKITVLITLQFTSSPDSFFKLKSNEWRFTRRSSMWFVKSFCA